MAQSAFRTIISFDAANRREARTSQPAGLELSRSSAGQASKGLNFNKEATQLGAVPSALFLGLSELAWALAN